MRGRVVAAMQAMGLDAIVCPAGVMPAALSGDAAKVTAAMTVPPKCAF